MFPQSVDVGCGHNASGGWIVNSYEVVIKSRDHNAETGGAVSKYSLVYEQGVEGKGKREKVGENPIELC